MAPDDSFHDPQQAQLRLRARRWGALLDGGTGGDPRRSPLRIALLEDAWLRFRAMGFAPDARPVALRRALTDALRQAWRAGRSAALSASDDPFAALHLRRLARLESLEAGLGTSADTATLLAWDTVLTAAELRPSAVPEVGAALRHAAAARADGALRRHLQGVLTAATAGDPGPFLRRQGLTTAADVVAHFFEQVEEALILIAPPAEAEARLRTAAANLRRWDQVLVGVHTRLATRRDGEEAAQAVVARFLEPRIIAAYASLPAEEIERIALVAGRNLVISTLAGPAARAQPMESIAEPQEASPGPEARFAQREHWVRLFAAVDQALADGRLTAQELVFLWLAPALGAGEAWRISGGALARVGSANYHQKRGMDLLHALVGAEAPWQRPPNPGRPDAHTRGLVGLLALRAGPDPYLERAAGMPEDARQQARPPADTELLALLKLFNLGAGTVPGGGALVARCLRLQRWDVDRRAALAAILAQVEADGSARSALGFSPSASASDSASAASLAGQDVAFLLATMVLGLPGEATRALEAGAAVAAPWAEVVRRWFQAPGPAHEVIEQLRRAPWPLPAPDPAPPKRPVEREARLRQHLQDLSA